MTPDFDVMVAGHICLDVQPDLSGNARKPFEEIFLPGHLVSSGPVLYSTGGAVANTGLGLNKLGIATCLVGKIGRDLFGQAIRQAVSTYGEHLADELLIDPSLDTSYSIIINYPGVDRIFLHNPGANDSFQASDVPFDQLKRVRLFHFGYPPLMQATFT